ncbi:Copia protein [Linum grandiflorum]
MQGPIQILCDSQSAISIVRNPVHHDRTKHVELDRDFIFENVSSGRIKLDYVSTSLQTTDVFTKALHKPLFDEMIGKLGMFNVFITQLEGECGITLKLNRKFFIL